MLEKSQILEVSAEEIEVIEAALQTQSQILNVQANAGGNTARDRLNQVKRVLARLTQQNAAMRTTGKAKSKCNAGIFGWFGRMRAAN